MTVPAAAAVDVGGSLLPDGAIEARRPGGAQHSLVSVDVVDDPRFGRALRVATVEGANGESNAFVALDLAAPFAAGASASPGSGRAARHR